MAKKRYLVCISTRVIYAAKIIESVHRQFRMLTKTTFCGYSKCLKKMDYADKKLEFNHLSTCNSL